MSKGFIPIKRTLFEHFLFNEHRVFSRFEAWLDLIQLASFMDGQTELIKGKAITRNRGEVVASIRWIANRWNWSIHKTFDFIEVLHSHNMVVVGKENGITRLSLVNFEKHNSIGKDEGNAEGNSKSGNGTGFGQNQGTQKGTPAESRGNSKGNTKKSDSKGFDGNEGTLSGTNGEQSGNSQGTNIKKDNNSNNQTTEGGAGAPAPPGDGNEVDEKEKAMLLRREHFVKDLSAYQTKYPREMLNAFYRHWSEPNKSRSKMKFEMETTWELGRRLVKWEEKEALWNKGRSAANAAPEQPVAKALESMYARFLGGTFDSKYLTEKHFDFLEGLGMLQLDDRIIGEAVLIRIKSLTGGNHAGEQRAVEAYKTGLWPADMDCQADEPNRTRVAKKLALIEFFQRARSNNQKKLIDGTS